MSHRGDTTGKVDCSVKRGLIGRFHGLIKPQVDFKFNLRVVENSTGQNEHGGMENIIGKRIAGALKATGNGQAWLAEATGVSVNAVSKWTRTGKISREKAVLVAAALKLSLDQLLTEPEGKVAEIGLRRPLERLDDEEAELLQLFREASPDGKKMIRAQAELAAAASVGRSGRAHN